MASAAAKESARSGQAAAPIPRSASSSSSSSSSSGDSSNSSGPERQCDLLTRLKVYLQASMGFGFTRATALQATEQSLSPSLKTIDNSGKRIEESYDMDQDNVLGEGGYASVVTGRDKRSGAVRAVKCIMKCRVRSAKRLQQEVEIMLMLDHPNVLRLFETFEDRRFVYLVLELCEGGDLFDHVSRGVMSEETAATVMQQVFRAVAHLHTAGICHRDIKPENFLFRDEGPVDGNQLKLADFGIAARCGADRKPLSTKTGTPQYVAPEILARSPAYDSKCDLWSCGVLLYLLLTKRLPFHGRDDRSTLASVMLGQLSFPSELFANTSREAKHLIRRLVASDPASRYTAEEALRDPWIEEYAKKEEKVQNALRHSIRELQAFHSASKLKQEALRLVARHLDTRRLESLGKIFSQIDADDNGTVSREEMTRGLREAGVPPEQFQGLMTALDGDGSGQIDYTEFLAATMERRVYLEESACWNAFRMFDRNDDGVISQQEMADVLSSRSIQGTFSDVAARLMQEADLDSNGYIDFEEFMAMLRK